MNWSNMSTDELAKLLETDPKMRQAADRFIRELMDIVRQRFTEEDWRRLVDVLVEGFGE